MASDSVTKTGFIKVTGYPTTMSLDFESVNNFSLNFYPWMVVDMNSGNTYGIQGVYFPNNYQPMAWICFNPALTTPPLTNMIPHSGQKLGCSFSSTPPNNPNDKWLISPKISLGLNPQVEFWVRSYNNQFGDEKYNVAVSTTDLNPSSFVPLTTVPESAPTEWTRKPYSLSAYANTDVYIGIQCVTNDGFILMVDDISITSSLGLEEQQSLENLAVFPNPARDFITVNCPAIGSSPVKIDLISTLGATARSFDEQPVAGRMMIDIHDLPQGVYLMHIMCGKGQATRKVSIFN